MRRLVLQQVLTFARAGISVHRLQLYPQEREGRDRCKVLRSVCQSSAHLEEDLELKLNSFMTWQDMVADFRQRVDEFNACVPYVGVSLGARLDDPGLTVLLSLLPVAPTPGEVALPPSLSEAIRAVAVLQCLSRLATAPYLAAGMTATPGTNPHRVPSVCWLDMQDAFLLLEHTHCDLDKCLATQPLPTAKGAWVVSLVKFASLFGLDASSTRSKDTTIDRTSAYQTKDLIPTSAGSTERIFAALNSGHEHMVAEAARLLTRIWAPATAGLGVGPWYLPRGGLHASDSDPRPSAPPDAVTGARAAKSACLQPPGR